ncbi:hypothetical protein FRB94_001242 [Tulasnella sp. JGI-2019a]|nr:hypothetical protein FRB94_001242 [Tulasnella sp. JGI-2019a]
MLASFSQFIRDTGNSLSKPAGALFSEPSHANQHQEKSSSPDTDIASVATSVNGDNEGATERKSTIDDAEARREERRRKRSNMIHETFIVVRPPPSVSNHPLNLQLQLVPPSTREQARQASGSTTASAISNRTAESTSDDPNIPTRERRPSLRSNRSATSLYSTASANSTTYSFASTASNATGSTGGGRRIIPLYNLSAHNVITNTITDAGTDAKIAKFGKRGIEVINLGILECHEVYGVVLSDPGLFMDTRLARTESKVGWLKVRKENDGGSFISGGSGPPSISERQQAPPSISEMHETPSSSTSHLDSSKSDHMATPTASTNASMTNQPSTPTPNSAKKIFGKMFKRKEAATTPTKTPTTPRITGGANMPTPTTPTPVTPILSPSTSIFARKQRQQPSSSSQQPHEPTIQEDPFDVLAAVGTLQPPCLGTQATLLHRETSGGRIVPAGAITALNNVTGGAGTRTSLQLHKSRSKGSFSEDVGPSRQSIDTALHPVISTTPSVVPPNIAIPPVPVGYRKTLHSYEWVIRKWIKGADTGLFGIKEGLISAKSAVFNTSGVGSNDSGAMEVEVRFEWVKGKGSVARARDKIARLRVTGEEEEGGGTRAGGRRERPRSMLAAGSEAGSRPQSMVFNPSASSLVLDPTADSHANLGVALKKQRQSPSKNGAKANQYTRSPSPTRPSLESRRSSDESTENRSVNATAPAVDNSTTVYKGKKRRTGSNGPKDREAALMGLGLGQPGAVGAGIGGGEEAAAMFGGDDVFGTGVMVDDPDSDPEDSETPWTCTLFVGPPASREVLPDPFNPAPATSGLGAEGRRGSIALTSPGVSGSRSASVLGSPDVASHARFSTSVSAHQFPGNNDPSLLQPGGGHRKGATATGTERAVIEEKKGVKIKVGVLTPAPYHPKVVSQLRMPFPLPDVNVRRMELVRPGEAIDGSGKGGDLILTMEEIKDVVCVTGLWLVVREGFGGLERRRKGDGWRIRG